MRQHRGRFLWVLCAFAGMYVSPSQTGRAQDTFSIVAVDSSTGMVGSAGASCIDGAIIISDVHPGVGVVHTQADWRSENQDYARILMNQGQSPQQIIDSLVAHDVQGNPGMRQYGVIDLVGGGRSASWTGTNCFDYKGHILGPNYAIQGNILLGRQILDSMQTRFLNTSGTFTDRLMAALQGAKVPGADTRCMASGRSAISAFIKVAWPRDTTGRLFLDLNVDNMPAPYDPIDSLQGLFDQWKSFPYLNTRSIAFGSYPIGERSDSVTIHLINYSLNPLTIPGISVPDSHFVVSGLPILPAVLAPCQALAFSVSFVPQSAVNLLDTISITTNDSLHPAGIIRLTGRGIVITPAEHGVMYVTSAAQPEGLLYSVNTATGALMPRGPLGVPQIGSLAIRPSSKEIYGTVATPLSAFLYRISANSGAAGLAGIVPLGSLRAIAFSPGDTLYGVTASGKLYRIDLTTGDTTYVGKAVGLSYSGISFSPTSGRLWASVFTPIDSIYTLNPATGAATFVGVTGFGGLTSSIAFDPLGVLYALIDNGSGEDYLATLDTISAAGTIVAGPLTVHNLHAIAMRTDSVGAVSVEDQQGETIPLEFLLRQNYPNPFNPSTTIKYDLPQTSHVSLSVYDVLGREVATLVNEEKSAGTYTVRWDASAVSSGVYFYRLRAGDFVQTRSMMIIK